MPFITIEIPSQFSFDLGPFVSKIHPFLSESLNIPLEKLKTKRLLISDAIVGHGDPNHNYAHIRLELMRGRDKEKLKAACSELLRAFTEAIKAQNPHSHARVTCEFRELDPELMVAELLPGAAKSQ